MVAPKHVSNDFDGDGKSDLLWHNDDGRVAAWLGTQTGGFVTNWPGENANPDPGFSIAATGDFNGDGTADVLWRHTLGFLLVVASTPGGRDAYWESPITVNWDVAGAGDFNGDGITDILFRSTNGTITNWLGSETGSFADNGSQAGSSVSVDWHVAGIADFNGDGKADILWRNDDGRITDWLGTATGAFQPNSANFLDKVSTDWQVDGVGDFNGDGKADILWRNTDGRITDWLGTGTGAFTDNVANAYNSVSLDWHVADIGDYNGDNRADIVWRNDDGRVTDWLGTMGGGFDPNSANALYSVPADWHIVSAPFHFAEPGTSPWDY